MRSRDKERGGNLEKGNKKVEKNRGEKKKSGREVRKKKDRERGRRDEKVGK